MAPMVLKIRVAIIGMFLVALTAFFFWASAGAYPQEKYAEIVTYNRAPPPASNDAVSDRAVGGCSNYNLSVGHASVQARLHSLQS